MRFCVLRVLERQFHCSYVKVSQDHTHFVKQRFRTKQFKWFNTDCLVKAALGSLKKGGLVKAT